jgi:CHASE2 domain-containing sensor protein
MGQLARKGTLYWLRVLTLTVAGTALGHWLSDDRIWVDLRYKIYQQQLDLTPRKPFAERVIVVLVGDDDYWKGELGRRVPIKRSYLAKMVRELVAANPAVIALDFDLASPLPDGRLVEHPDYESERKEFLKAIREALERTKIVLPRTIDFDNQKNYVITSDIHDGFDFGPKKQNLYTGYIALPYDTRRVPGVLALKGAQPSIDSFAVAIAKAYDEAALGRIPKSDSLPFGSYLRHDEFRQFSAGDVLERRPEVLGRLAHKIVILGGAWHSQGYGRGSRIDTYFTPVGWIGGAFIHANYVEALLDGRVYSALNEKIVMALEVALVLVGAIVFALEIRPSVKWLSATALCLVLLVMSYFLFQNLGLFFEFFIPLLLIAGHSLLDQILEWRTLARSYSVQHEVHE